MTRTTEKALTIVVAAVALVLGLFFLVVSLPGRGLIGLALGVACIIVAVMAVRRI